MVHFQPGNWADTSCHKQWLLQWPGSEMHTLDYMVPEWWRLHSAGLANLCEMMALGKPLLLALTKACPVHLLKSRCFLFFVFLDLILKIRLKDDSCEKNEAILWRVAALWDKGNNFWKPACSTLLVRCERRAASSRTWAEKFPFNP